MLPSRRKAFSCAASSLLCDEAIRTCHSRLSQFSNPGLKLLDSNGGAGVPSRGVGASRIATVCTLRREPRSCIQSWGSLYNRHQFAFANDATAAGRHCWNCGAAAAVTAGPFLACSACHAVQPVDSSIDYFDIFGIERGYNIAEDSLESKYKDWQKKLHPDLVHTKSARERNYAAEQSARVIDAYRTLRKPLSRALYLLQLQGVNVNEEETLTEPELLTEVLEIREAIEEANDSKELELIKLEVERKLGVWCKCYADAYGSEDFDQAVASARRMTYYEKAIQQIMEKL